MIGKKLAHYEIIEQIGSGGMGDVYRGRDTKLGREVALKVLPAEFSSDPARRSRFMREAQAIAALKHPNIVTIYSVEEAGDVTFITMELVEGDTLAERIREGGVTLDQFFAYSIPLADAVSSAHDQSITHRDLKPRNIMFDRDGRLKVLDFGLAKLLDTPPDATRAETVIASGDTGVGQILGTAAYMSPEQAEGKPIDHRSDIFSLGIVLYELATGERPFKGDTQISTISSILKDVPRHVSEVRTEMPRHVGRIISHCLEKLPDKRFQSAKDVRNELEGLKNEVDSGEITASQSITASVGAAPPSSVGDSGGPKKPLIPALIGAVVIVAAVLAFAFWPRGDGVETASVNVRDAADALEPAAAPTPREVAAVVTPDDDRTMAVVLPFDNLGSDDDAYFAAGMTDELTSRLSAVKGLGVISRTSAKQYDRTGKTLRQIGEDLGVDYVVEGSVRFAKTADGGGRVRITPLLIRVSDDTQIWSQTYDRTIDDVFDVQTEIANHVVSELGVTLGATERELVASKPTENMVAYEAYMRAKTYTSPQGNFAIDDAKVVGLYEKAVELDPDFFDAWVELSMHHSGIYNSPIDKTEARIQSARLALQKAEAIDADHPRTRIARGDYYYYCFRDYDRALEEYLAATQMVPNSAEAWQSVAWIYRRQGRWPEHFETVLKAHELDPQNSNRLYNIATSYAAMREFELAVEYCDRALEVNENEAMAVMNKADALVSWHGDYDEVMRFLQSTKPSIPRSFAETFYHLRFGSFDRARATVRQIPQVNPEFDAWKAHMFAIADYIENGREAAMGQLVVTEKLLRDILDGAPSNADMRETLAMNLAYQGRAEAAIREARLAVDLTAKDTFVGPVALETLAGVYAQVGRHNESIDILERLLKKNYRGAITETDLQQDPLWIPLREEPRFKALIRPSS